MATERDKLFQRIINLSQRTVERGCTEAEALVAAELLGRLLTEHGLSMSDVEIKETKCTGATINMGARAHDATFVCKALAEFTNTKVWIDRGIGSARLRWFGMPADVQVATYLFQVVQTAMDNETYAHRVKLWKDGRKNIGGRAGATAFRVGMANRINERLKEMTARKACAGRATGRDLVVLTNQVVEDQYANLGLKLAKAKPKRVRGHEQYLAGKAAGDRVHLDPAVTEGGSNKLLG